jgi:hypothetical protein
VINDASGHIVLAATQKLHSTNVFLGEATATQLASSTDFRSFDLEGDALLVILAVNQPLLFTSWQFPSVVSNITVNLSSFQSLNALKVFRCANFQAHSLTNWAITYLVFGSIPLGSSILSSL